MSWPTISASTTIVSTSSAPADRGRAREESWLPKIVDEDRREFQLEERQVPARAKRVDRAGGRTCALGDDGVPAGRFEGQIAERDQRVDVRVAPHRPGARLQGP